MYNIVDIHKENTYLKELHTKTSINRVLIFRKAKEFFEADKANKANESKKLKKLLFFLLSITKVKTFVNYISRSILIIIIQNI